MSRDLYATQIANNPFDATEARLAQEALDKEHSKAEIKDRAFELRLATLKDLVEGQQSDDDPVADARDSRDAIVKEITERKDREYQEKIDGLQEAASQKDEAIAQLRDDLQSATARAEELERSAADSEAALEKATAQLQEIEDGKKGTSRKQLLMDAGLGEYEAAAAASKFADADDKIFSDIIDVYQNLSSSTPSAPSPSPSPSPTLSLDDPVDAGGETMSDLVQGFNDDDATIDIERPADGASLEADLTENSDDADSGDLGFQIDPS